MVISLPVVYLAVGGVVIAAVLIVLIVRSQNGPDYSADILYLQSRSSLDGEPWWERAAVARRMSIDNNICRVCQKPTTTQCAQCKSVKYCGPVCQRKDWSSSHKFECPNFKARRQLEAKAAAAGNSKPPFLDRHEDAPVPQQVLFPYELFMQLRKNPNSCRRAPVGLINHGNNCYANAALQCLLYTKPLRAFLDQGLHNKGCNKPHDRDWCLLCVLTRLCQEVSDAPLHAEMSLKPLLRHLRRFAKTMSYGRQEDAHEFFYSVLNTMEAIMLTNFGGKDRFDMRTQETTLVHHVFGGYLRSQVVCCSCGAASRRYEAALDLQLEVPAGVDRLEDVLQRHTAEEVLDGDNCYACDGCKQRCRATRSTRFEVAPNTLVLCLKRFGTGRFSKINKILVYGEKLDLGPFMARGAMDNAPTTYTLTGVVVHLDQMNSTSFGHYVSFVRSWEGSGSNGSSGQWYACDDGRVCRCRAADVLAQNAYMLFYQRDFPKPAPQPGYMRPKPLLPLTAAQQAAAAAAAAAQAAAPEPKPAAAPAQPCVSDTQRLDQRLHEQEQAAAAAAAAAAGELPQQPAVPEPQPLPQQQQQRLEAMQSTPAPEQPDAAAELLPRIATAPAALGLLATRVDSSSRDDEETGSHATSSSCLADVSGCSTPSYQANGSAAAAASDSWAFSSHRNSNTTSSCSRGPSRLSSEQPAAAAAAAAAAEATGQGSAAKLPAHTLLRRRKQQHPPPAGASAAVQHGGTSASGDSQGSGSSRSSTSCPSMQYRVEAAGPELLRVCVELPGVTAAADVAVAVESSFGPGGCQQQSLWLRVPGRFAELQLQLAEYLRAGQSVGGVVGKLYRAKQRLKLKLQLVKAAAAAAGAAAEAAEAAAGSSGPAGGSSNGSGSEAEQSSGKLVVDYHLTDSFDTSSSGSESEGYKPARRGMHAIASERDLCSIFGRHSSTVAQQLLQQLQQQRQGTAGVGDEEQEAGDAAEAAADAAAGASGSSSKKPAKKKAGSGKKKRK